jgi:hypothetical protein
VTKWPSECIAFLESSGGAEGGDFTRSIVLRLACRMRCDVDIDMYNNSVLSDYLVVVISDH